METTDTGKLETTDTRHSLHCRYWRLQILDTKNRQILQIPDIPADITAIGAPLASQV